MIKLKPLLNEQLVSEALTSGDDVLRSYNTETTKQGAPEWFMSQGTNNWHDKKAYCSAYITENDKPIRIWVEVKTRWLRKPGDSHTSHHDRVRKAIAKVSKVWSGEAKRLHKEQDISEIGNQSTRSWSECFTQALKSPKLSPFIMGSGTDKATAQDPVNFTPRI